MYTNNYMMFKFACLPIGHTSRGGGRYSGYMISYYIIVQYVIVHPSTRFGHFQYSRSRVSPTVVCHSIV